MATHSCILAWRIPWTEEPSGLLPLGLQRVGHECARTWVCTHAVCVSALKRQNTEESSVLCDPMDCSPPGSSVHGILQARILEWGAISFSRGSSQPRDRTLSLLHWQAGSLPLVPPGKPHKRHNYKSKSWIVDAWMLEERRWRRKR